MTCHEFEQRATALTLWELSRAQDQPVVEHAGACQKCAAWLQQQRMLAAAMQTLQAQTAGCAAGPDTEDALLRAFRWGPSQPAQPQMEPRFTPVAARLSRFFEVGAYVAVAAAIVVALFIGVRVWQQRSANLPVNSQVVQPSVIAPSVVTGKSEPQSHRQLAAVEQSSVKRSLTPRVPPASESNADTASTDGDYVALMLCDPLSCSSDSQVVRMELPSPVAGGQDAQMRIADVVVGYDGVVRAVRIVN
jgi:hypothetical protein